jgi:hypothetical protein
MAALVRNIRWPWVVIVSLGGAALMVGLSGAVEGVFAADETTQAAPSPGATVTVVPSASATALPATPTPVPTEAPPPQRIPSVGERVTADSVRVYTGDGDCLNVRPAPGTTFEAVPFTCLPEGSLLRLTGPAQEADGETWRYALGSGWVATRYVREEPSPTFTASPSGLMTVWGWGPNVRRPDGVESPDVVVITVDNASGAVLSRVSFPSSGGGIGSGGPKLAPRGDYIAHTLLDHSKGTMSTVVGRTSDGSFKLLPGLAPEGWSDGGKLAVQTSLCDSTCQYTVAVYDPASDTTTVVAEKSSSAFAGWALDDSLYLQDYSVPERISLVLVDFDGNRRVIATYPADRAIFGGVVSPSGRYLFSQGMYGPLRGLDLTTGEPLDLPRAPQRELAGSCGGGWSSVNGWLNDNTVFYHERSSSNRQDGITFLDIRTGARRVLPYFDVQDMRRVSPGLITFSTWSSAGDGDVVTFLLDVASGEAAPLVTGSGAVWR